MCQFSDKTNNFDFLGPNLTKNGFWGRNFKNLSLDSESVPSGCSMWQFSIKMGNFGFFDPSLGKLASYVQYFGSNIVEDVAESWVEAEMSWVEVDGAGRRLKWAGWRWKELGGGGWSWVEVGPRFSNTLFFMSIFKSLLFFFAFKMTSFTDISRILLKFIQFVMIYRRLGEYLLRRTPLSDCFS